VEVWVLRLLISHLELAVFQLVSLLVFPLVLEEVSLAAVEVGVVEVEAAVAPDNPQGIISLLKIL
jgi:hypothetical protein